MNAKNIAVKPLWQKTPFKGFVMAALALDLIAILAFLLLKNYLPPVVPLLYGRPSGEGQLLPSVGLLLAPALSILFIIVNSLIGSFTGDVFVKKLLVASAFLMSLLTSITVFKIIFLVGFF